MSFGMKEDRYAEEAIAKLRQVDVLVSQGQSLADAIRQIGVGEVTYYRWRQASSMQRLIVSAFQESPGVPGPSSFLSG